MELSLKRLGLLMKKQFIENRKFYISGFIGIICFMATLFAFTLANNNNFDAKIQNIFLGFGLISFGCLFTLTLFSKLDKKDGRNQFLSLPATALEKLLCGITYGYILFPLVYLMAIYPLIVLANYINVHYMGSVEQSSIFTFNKLQLTLFPIFYVLQTLILLLSVLLRKFKVPLSIAVLTFLFFSTTYFTAKINNLFVPAGFEKAINVEARTYNDEHVLVGKETKSLSQSFYVRKNNTPMGGVAYFSEKTSVKLSLSDFQQTCFYVFLLLSIPFMWLITWFRLKESEVN